MKISSPKFSFCYVFFGCIKMVNFYGSELIYRLQRFDPVDTRPWQPRSLHSTSTRPVCLHSRPLKFFFDVKNSLQKYISIAKKPKKKRTSSKIVGFYVIKKAVKIQTLFISVSEKEKKKKIKLRKL
jgi:hypothetical protein